MKTFLLCFCLLVGMLGQAFGFEGFLKLGAAANVTVTLIDSTDHVTGKTGLTLTIWATKAAGTPASIAPTVTELDSTNVKGVYKLALTAAMVDTLGEFQLHITATGADPADLKWEVSTYLPGEAAILQADQAVNVTKVAGTTQTARDLGANLDATVSSRMATYTQPAGFLGATFPTGTIASTTNITGGTVTISTLPAIPNNWLTAAGVAAGALNGKGDWPIGKTGYSLTPAYNPATVDPLGVILPASYTGQQAGNLIWRTGNKP
jgi:hypothetical protein